MSCIFISYRRDDSAYAAHQLRDRLADHFGIDNIIFDVESIPLGTDFRNYITEQITKCDVLLAVMGNEWLNTINARSDDPKDFVRIEIEAALKRDIPVIPVLVEKAVMPDDSALPKSLADLAYRNATEVRAGADFHSQLDRLVAALENLLGTGPTKKSEPVIPPPVTTENTIQPKSSSMGRFAVVAVLLIAVLAGGAIWLYVPHEKNTVVNHSKDEAADAARLAEEKRKAEQARRDEEKRKAELAQLAEQKRKAEQARRDEEARKAEQARLDEEKRKAEQARLDAQKRKAEQARLDEQKRKAEQARLDELKRKAELQRKSVASTMPSPPTLLSAAVPKSNTPSAADEYAGKYENHQYDNGGKNDWHFVTITKMNDRSLRWANRAGVSWNLTLTSNPNVLNVDSNAPYYKQGFHTVKVQRDASGRIIGLYGPSNELYQRETR